MTILPHAASRQRPSADLLEQKLAPCNLNQIFFPGYTVVACVRTRESLTLKLETTEPAICPKCGEPCSKIHDTRYRLIRDAPFPGVTVVWLLVPIRRVRCKCGCHRTEIIPWIAHHEQCTNRFIALIQNRCGVVTPQRRLSPPNTTSVGMLFAALTRSSSRHCSPM